MNRTDYAQSVILARVYEKRLLGRQKIERMIDALNAEEVYKILMDSEYSKSAAGVFDIYDYVQLLNQELSRTRDIAEELLADRRILEIMTLRYDYHNLKIIAKAKLTGTDLSEKFIPSKNTDPKTLQAQVEAEKWNVMPVRFSLALKEALGEYDRTRDPQVVDIVLDRHYFAHMKELAKEVEVPFFDQYILGQIDFYNVISLLRMQRMHKTVHFAEKVFVEGGRIPKSKLLSLMGADLEKVQTSLKTEAIGPYVIKGLSAYRKTGSLYTMEQQRKAYFDALTRDARFITFGPEPIIAYLLAKEEELEQVRFIIVGKLNDIPAERIRERLGD